jgi:hypothetical protein
MSRTTFFQESAGMDASVRSAEWRRSKEEAGYCRVVYWLPPDVKRGIAMLAYRRGESPSRCVEAAYHALEVSETTPTSRLTGDQLLAIARQTADILERRQAERAAAPGDDGPRENLPVPPSVVAQQRPGKTGGRPAVALETLAHICQVWRDHPAMSYTDLCTYLDEHGIYRSVSPKTGKAVRMSSGTVFPWLRYGVKMGYLTEEELVHHPKRGGKGRRSR